MNNASVILIRFLQFEESSVTLYHLSHSIHVFGVIGIEKKVNYVYTILEEGIKKNFDRILNNRKIKIIAS